MKRIRRNTATRTKKAGPRILITYDLYTPESVEEGDVAESGWIDEGGVSMRPDEYDQEEGISAVDKAVKFLKDNGPVEASSSFFHKGIWYTGPDDTNFRTGEIEQRSFHLVGFGEAKEREIFNRLTRRR